MASRASSRTLGNSSKQQKSKNARIVPKQKGVVMKVDDNKTEDTSSSSTHEEPLKKISTMAFEVNKAPKLEDADRKDLEHFSYVDRRE